MTEGIDTRERIVLEELHAGVATLSLVLALYAIFASTLGWNDGYDQVLSWLLPVHAVAFLSVLVLYAVALEAFWTALGVIGSDD